MSRTIARALGSVALPFAIGCHGYYVVKGSVHNAAGGPLAAVEVTARGMKEDAPSPGTLYGLARSDEDGSYRLSFLGPPASWRERIAFVFLRPGYVASCVSVLSSEAATCPDGNRCWILETVLAEGNDADAPTCRNPPG